ncbi:WD repeat-containing protein 31-like [Patiria miniata]|uniref:Guanine nucleotide-binding protein subunit beta-like protein n=1 Tax=Patiria miniata TaxID=46514 RepID=A0A913Z5G2_PATMI|nr:WD repeat-containing protein 31-like [Patiria miniata]
MGKKQSKMKDRGSSRSRIYGHGFGDYTAVNSMEIADVKRYTPVHTDAVTSVTIAGDVSYITGSADQSMVLYRWMEGRLMQRWVGHKREITKVTHAPELEATFSASRDKTIRMWKRGTTDGGTVEQQNCKQTFTGHELVVTGIAFGNGKLCSGSRDNSVRQWDISTGQCINQSIIPRNLVTHIKWIPGESMLAQTSEDKCLRLWDTRTLTEAHVFPKKQYIQTCCDVSSDGNYCLTSSNGVGGRGCEATLWDLRAHSLVAEYQGHQQTVGGCCFIPSMYSKQLVATCSNDATVRIWDRNTCACITVLNIAGFGSLTSIAANVDKSICVGSTTPGVHVANLLEEPEGTFRFIYTAQY